MFKLDIKFLLFYVLSFCHVPILCMEQEPEMVRYQKNAALVLVKIESIIEKEDTFKALTIKSTYNELAKCLLGISSGRINWKWLGILRKSYNAALMKLEQVYGQRRTFSVLMNTENISAKLKEQAEVAKKNYNIIRKVLNECEQETIDWLWLENKREFLRNVLEKIAKIYQHKRILKKIFINGKGKNLKKEVKTIKKNYNILREILGESKQNIIDWQWLKTKKREYSDFLAVYWVFEEIESICEIKKCLDDEYVVDKIDKVEHLKKIQCEVLQKYNKIRKEFNKQKESNIDLEWLVGKKNKFLNIAQEEIPDMHTI